MGHCQSCVYDYFNPPLPPHLRQPVWNEPPPRVTPRRHGKVNTLWSVYYDIGTLARDITEGHTGDVARAHALFMYVSQLEYDNPSVQNKTYNVKQDEATVHLNKTGVCSGFSQYYMKLLCEVGIGVRIVTGYTDQDTDPGHAWNQVRLNGKWINVDTTWKLFDFAYTRHTQRRVYYDSTL